MREKARLEAITGEGGLHASGQGGGRDGVCSEESIECPTARDRPSTDQHPVRMVGNVHIVGAASKSMSHIFEKGSHLIVRDGGDDGRRPSAQSLLIASGKRRGLQLARVRLDCMDVVS